MMNSALSTKLEIAAASGLKPEVAGPPVLMAHQVDALIALRAHRNWALFMEQGTGKTRCILQEARESAHAGRAEKVLVLAPNGVHRAWIDDQVPTHLSNFPVACFLWRSGQGESARGRAFLDFMARSELLKIMAVNIEALLVGKARDLMRAFAPTTVVIDESTTIKNHKAQRSKLAWALAALPSVCRRRLLTGTPATESPFDLWSQFRLMEREPFEHRYFTAFKHCYGVFERKRNWRQGRDYDDLVSYKNLDELNRLVAARSFRVTKDECLDLPPKTYQRRFFEMPKEQRRVYDDLLKRTVAEIEDGRIMTAAMAMTRVLRLQQVASGLFASDDEDAATHFVPGDRDQRLAAMLDVLREGGALSGRRNAVVWCRFTPDVDRAIWALSQMGKERGGQVAVRYDGRVSDVDRAENLAAFMGKGASDATVLVGNARAGGRGLNLQAASLVVYYSHDWSLETRLQSEDRCHRIGQRSAVTYVDLIAEDTVDDRIVLALRAKRNLMAELLTPAAIKEELLCQRR